METAILQQAFAQKHVTKEMFEAQANAILEQVENGQISALRAMYEMKATMATFEIALKKINENAIKEAENYGDGTFKYNNCDVTLKEVGVRYDYSSCPLWVDAKSREEIVANERKDIESKIKGGKLIDEESGEVYVAKKKSSQGVEFSFRKDTDTDESVKAKKEK